MKIAGNWQAKKRIVARKLVSAFLKHVESLPLQADIEPTTYCNLKCAMCQTSTWNRAKIHMRPDTLKQILNDIPSLEQVKLQGMGEPLMNPNLFSLIRLLVEKNIQVSLITNGLLLNEEIVQELRASGIRSIYVSVDTLKTERYMKIRNTDKLERLLSNLGMLINASHGTYETGVMAMVMKDNVDELTDVVKTVIGLGVKKVAFQDSLTSWGKEEWQMNDGLNATVEKSREVLNQVRDICRANQVDFELIRNKFDSRSDKCPWPFHNVFISAEGQVQPCCKISDPDILTFGNITKKRFGRIWNSKAYREFRKRFCEGRIHKLCEMCYD